MGNQGHRWQPGESGNPRGRQPKVSTLTKTLERAGNKAARDVDGRNRTLKRILARILWELAVTGQTRMLPDANGGQRLMVADPDDTLKAAQFLYSHIDGPPRTELDITSGGQSLAAIRLCWPEGEEENGNQETEETGGAGDLPSATPSDSTESL